MTAAKPLEVPLPILLNQQSNEITYENNDCDDENEYSDTDSLSSLPHPSIFDKTSLDDANPDNEHLALTSMVRRVYLSYLHKSIINNHKTCCTIKNISRMQLKKFCSELELCAIRASLQTPLYRQAMLKMISDIKQTTSCEKIQNKLALFLEMKPAKVDAAVQTCEELLPLEIKRSGSPIDKQLVEVTALKIEPGKSLEERISEIFQPSMELQIKSDMMEYYEEQQNLDDKETVVEEGIEQDSASEQTICDDCIQVKEETIDSIDTILNPPKEEEENSRDSLTKHLEDMFHQSDDSDDLTAMIEKYSGVSKLSVDKEIRNLNQEQSVSTPSETTPKSITQFSDNSTILSEQTQANMSTTAGTKRKLSLTHYRNSKKIIQETIEDKVKDKAAKKLGGVWLVERIHQVSKLKAKLIKLSARDYRKHGKIIDRFMDLFGEDNGEDLEPDSPIRIEEHLTWCKERIAPWVVEHLMPFYTQEKIIADRKLFKEVARYIADKLIIENTFPEEDDVKQYIKDYFRNKPSIKSQADIYI